LGFLLGAAATLSYFSAGGVKAQTAAAPSDQAHLVAITSPIQFNAQNDTLKSDRDREAEALVRWGCENPAAYYQQYVQPLMTVPPKPLLAIADPKTAIAQHDATMTPDERAAHRAVKQAFEGKASQP
jgi:hypothetical protein